MRYEKLSSKDVLKLLAISGVVISSIAFPNLAIAYNYLGKEWAKYKKGDIGRIVKRFHKQELINISEKDGQIFLELSEKGKTRLIRNSFNDIFLKKHRDGKFRIATFDIPDQKRAARDVFRKKLKDLGFIQIQKSVFISAYPCKDELEFVINLLEIQQYVMLFQIGRVELGDKFSFKQDK